MRPEQRDTAFGVCVICVQHAKVSTLIARLDPHGYGARTTVNSGSSFVAAIVPFRLWLSLKQPSITLTMMSARSAFGWKAMLKMRSGTT